jgi:hypothetical protein
MILRFGVPQLALMNGFGPMTLFELSLDASVVPESCIHVMLNFDCGTHLSRIILSLVISFFSPLLSVCFD